MHFALLTYVAVDMNITDTAVKCLRKTRQQSPFYGRYTEQVN